MTTKAEYTKGPVRLVRLASSFDSRVPSFGIAYGRAGNRLAIVDGEGNSSGQNEANASLIAEAFNVATETGLTPRQIADQRSELLAALKSIRGLAKRNSVNPDEIYFTADRAIAKGGGAA